MSQRLRFRAPWGMALKGMTGLSVVLLVGIALIGTFAGPRESPLWIFGMIVMPLVLVIGPALFTIRGYVLTRRALLVQRIGWNSTLDLAGLQSAEADPKAMARSIRLFGNGGMFCFAGLFRNKKLGRYRAFATDAKRAVILKFRDRTVVVTPENPEAFVAKIRELRRLR